MRRRSILVIAAAAAVGSGVSAYRFALEYRRRAGFPWRRPVEGSPLDFGLPCEPVSIPSDTGLLPGWFIAAGAGAEAPNGGAPLDGPAPERRQERHPAVVIVHGWESNRARSIRQALYLHAAGFHCLLFDVRGHGDNPPETLPISAAEFGADAAAAVRYLLDRPEVSAVGIVGHSMGGAGALIAAAQEPRVGAVVAVSAPADPVNLTRIAFGLAGLHVPRLIATPLAWLTARVFLQPRGHSLDDASASAAAARYTGPLLVAQGADDRAVPVGQLHAIARAALAGRGAGSAPVETLVLPGFGHRWLYEVPAYRRTVATFLARALGGPTDPDEAGRLAAACAVSRPDDPVQGFGALGRVGSTDPSSEGSQ